VILLVIARSDALLMLEFQRRAEVIPELWPWSGVNITVLWNTIYIETVLAQLRQEDYAVRDEDIAVVALRS
jgi:hypothetical protein